MFTLVFTSIKMCLQTKKDITYTTYLNDYQEAVSHY